MNDQLLFWAEPKLKIVRVKPLTKICNESLPAGYIDAMIDLHKEEFRLIRESELEMARLKGIAEVCEGLSFGSD